LVVQAIASVGKYSQKCLSSDRMIQSGGLKTKRKQKSVSVKKRIANARVEGLSLTEHGGQSEDYEGKEGRGLHGLLCWGCVAARTEKKKKGDNAASTFLPLHESVALREWCHRHYIVAVWL
jgi:hypothetical protein